ELAFCSGWTAWVGPELEPMFVSKGTGHAAAPIRVLESSRQWAVLDGPSAHGCTMFRADAYRRSGGYPPQVYYGQDWDLWYRLAEIGKFQMIGEVLYTMRVPPDTISSSAKNAQTAIGRLSRAALMARLERGDDAAILVRAAEIRPRGGRRSRCQRARGLY